MLGKYANKIISLLLDRSSPSSVFINLDLRHQSSKTSTTNLGTWPTALSVHFLWASHLSWPSCRCTHPDKILDALPTTCTGLLMSPSSTCILWPRSSGWKTRMSRDARGSPRVSQQQSGTGCRVGQQMPGLKGRRGRGACTGNMTQEEGPYAEGTDPGLQQQQE